MRLFRAFTSLPGLIRWSAIVTGGVFVLAIVVGFFNRPSSTPAAVSVVAPAATPGQLAAGTPSTTAAQSPAPAPAPAPAPQLGGGTPAAAGTAAILRSAAQIPPGVSFRDCARETLGLPENADAYTMAGVRFIAAATREECTTPTLSASPALAETFQPYVPARRGYVQITRAGLFTVDSTGEYTVTLTGNVGRPTRCALYAGDMGVPVLQADDYHGQFGGVAVVGLQAGRHELALACSFELRGNDAPGGVTVSIRSPGEQMPRLATLQTVAAAAVPAPATQGAK